MKILFITGSDIGGQQFNGYVLYKSLQGMGHDASMAVGKSEFQEPGIHEIGNSRLNKLNSYLTRFEQKLGLQATLPISTLALFHKLYYRNADVIHLQLLHTYPFISLFNLLQMNHNHQLVWTLHDLWMVSGHCIHSLGCPRWLSGCGDCPDLTLPIPVKRDSTAFEWNLKKFIMRKTRINLVVASQWMKERVQQSPILSHLPCTLIPFGVDTKIYRPRSKSESRALFDIPQDAVVLVFRATRWIYKGLTYIEKALHLLNETRPVCLLTFDEVGILKDIPPRYQVIELGYLKDRDRTATALSAADLFLAPSLAESFGMMAVESMACGTPVVAFSDTSLAEIVHAPLGGRIVRSKDSKEFASTIHELITNPDNLRLMSENCPRIVQQEYTLEKYVTRHLQLYENLHDEAEGKKS